MVSHYRGLGTALRRWPAVEAAVAGAATACAGDCRPFRGGWDRRRPRTSVVANKGLGPARPLAGHDFSPPVAAARTTLWPHPPWADAVAMPSACSLAVATAMVGGDLVRVLARADRVGPTGA